MNFRLRNILPVAFYYPYIFSLKLGYRSSYPLPHLLQKKKKIYKSILQKYYAYFVDKVFNKKLMNKKIKFIAIN